TRPNLIRLSAVAAMASSRERGFHPSRRSAFATVARRVLSSGGTSGLIFRSNRAAKRTSQLRAAAAAAMFALLAFIWSFPLGTRLSSALPGRGFGDNAMFLWNFWWMRRSRAAGQPFFHTDYLFAPFGTDVTLHTHTALTAFVGAAVLGPLDVLTALNVTTLASLSLNGL